MDQAPRTTMQLPARSQRGTRSDLWRRFAAGGSNLIGLLLLLGGLCSAVRTAAARHFSPRDDGAGNDVSAARAWPFVVGDGDPACLGWIKSGDHRHGKPGGIADGVDIDNADAARCERGGAGVVDR